MKTHSVKYFALSFALTAALSGCQKEKSAVMALGVEINKSEIPLRVLSGHLQFHSGNIVLEEIGFEGTLEGAEHPDKDVEVEQITTIDFATGLATPPLPTISLEAGTYREVELEVDLHETSDEAPLVLLGDYTHTNGEIIPLRFEYKDDELFEIEAEQITFTEAQFIEALIVLDPVFWFNTVPRNLLDNAVMGPDGVLTVSENSNEEIYEIVLDRMKINNDAEFD